LLVAEGLLALNQDTS